VGKVITGLSRPASTALGSDWIIMTRPQTFRMMLGSWCIGWPATALTGLLLSVGGDSLETESRAPDDRTVSVRKCVNATKMTQAG